MPHVLEDLNELERVSADLCKEVEFFRHNFELGRERYAAVVKRLKGKVDKISEKDLPYYYENHETDVKRHF